MTDGVAVTPSAATTRQTIDTDEVSRGGITVHQQVVKLSLGADGASDTLVDAGQQTAANSIPVVLASDHPVISVTGTLTATISDTITVIDGGGSLTVDGTVAVSGTVTVDTELPAAAALADAAANPTTPLVGAAVELFNGTTWDRARGDTTNGLDVDVTRLPALAAGSNVIGALTANQSVNVAQINGVTPLMGNGASGTGAQRVTIANDSTGVVGLNAGSNLAGRFNPEPQTANGLSMSKTVSAASTNATSVKGSAGQVYSIQAFNINAAARYLKLYNKGSAPTVGTDTPVKTLLIPGNTAGAGFVFDTGGMGLAFGTGIAFAITTGITDADTGAVAASEIVINIDYK